MKTKIFTQFIGKENTLESDMNKFMSDIPNIHIISLTQSSFQNGTTVILIYENHVISW